MSPDLQSLLRLAEAATPSVDAGQWECQKHGAISYLIGLDLAEPYGYSLAEVNAGDPQYTEAVAKFMEAASPAVVSALCKRLMAVEEVLRIAAPYICLTDHEGRDEDELREIYTEAAAKVDAVRVLIAAALSPSDGQVGK